MCEHDTIFTVELNNGSIIEVDSRSIDAMTPDEYFVCGDMCEDNDGNLTSYKCTVDSRFA